MSEILELIAWPFAGAIVFVGMHAWLGLNVLRRNVVFADLALAQLAALGGAVATAAGHAPGSTGGLAYGFCFAGVGAALLTMARRTPARVGREALIGIVYVVATALTVLVVDRSPQGAEHVKKMLVGSILTLSPDEVLHLALLYGGIGAVHAIFRHRLLALAHPDAARGGAAAFWDFVFYLSFGIVVTSSVAAAGVLLVFSFLIIPAVIGTLFTDRIAIALVIGWTAGTLASAAGLLGAFVFDAPTGAAVVVAFAAVLGTAGLLRIGLRALLRGGAVALPSLGLVAGLWLMAIPAADQPLLTLIERLTGVGPERWMSERERQDYAEAGESERRTHERVETLNSRERAARWQGAPLDDDTVRRIAAFQRSWNEMSRGERFVQDHLRTLARERARWRIGIPLALASAILLLPSWPRARRSVRFLRRG